MGNLNNSQNYCCCKKDKDGIPVDFVDIKACEVKESTELAKNSASIPDQTVFEFSQRSKSIRNNDINSLSLTYKKHQISNSLASMINSTELSLNGDTFNFRSFRLDQIQYRNRAIKIQRMFRNWFSNRQSLKQSFSTFSQYLSDSRPSINNHSLFLRHIIDNSKQPELYPQEKDRNQNHSRTVSTNAANSFLQSNAASRQTSEIKKPQSIKEISCRKFGVMHHYNKCKLYKQKMSVESIIELKQWLNFNANIKVNDEWLFGIKLYKNGSKVIGFFDESSNVNGVGYYESHNMTSYKGNKSINKI